MDIRVSVDRKCGKSVWVKIPDEYADEYESRIIEYAKALHLYYGGK